MLTKVYEYGGVHSGAAVSSVVWFALFTGFLTNQFMKSAAIRGPAVLTTTYILLILLICIVVTAYPRFRFSSHNTFENLHRWGGWFSLAIFWVELVLFVHAQTPRIGPAIVRQPAFYFLLVSSLHTILPWLRLHKLYITPEKLSNHAIRLHFTESVPLFVGLRISDAPLKEWHSFACIPARSGPGGSVLISDAGDWTKKTIQDPKPYYWVKGVPVTGVLCMARIFRKVVVVTTGSGIGPCLAVIQDIPIRGTSCRVIWSTPSPLETYGAEICNAVKMVDKEAIIIDTRKDGRRPNLVAIAWELYCREEAEAVFVISNPMLTKKVVYALEARGIPTFGPIWDS
ncbi:related to non-ribosomal peptide synthetase [Rhynchosporium agropyri]|uniref:Related to non-ribosomal peptide synthetase n=1 Tax=Rhynchosporium agropyri TaxID=914238 RepID=A0A1E1KEL0_9HELO|nr:related to non-ribosomal peptide synthetase [Rhynchosporium agropyri]